MSAASRLADLAYLDDARVRAARSATHVDVDVRSLPHRWVVCPLCDGRGSHCNPSIDAHGLSSEDFDQDPEFAEAYFSGAYDVPCARCAGRTTVPEVDVARCSFAQKRVLVQLRRDERDHELAQAEWRAELRAGA